MVRPRKYDEDEARHDQLVRDYVPHSMRDLVCLCTEYWSGGGMKKDPRDTGTAGGLSLATCTHCGKYLRWVQRKCKICKEHFVLTFMHPRYVRIFPTCWKCTNEDHDIWYLASKENPTVKANYDSGAYDDWPFQSDYARGILEPHPGDLVKKEPIDPDSITFTDFAFDFS